MQFSLPIYGQGAETERVGFASEGGGGGGFNTDRCKQTYGCKW